MTRAVLRLLHVTDTHLFATRDGRLRGVDTLHSLTAVLDRAARDRRPADAILVTGDIAQDESRGAYLHFRELLAARGLPVWCLPGNHDAPDLMREALADAPFAVGGAMRAGDWCIVLLDSHRPGEHGGRLTPAELARLRSTLEENRDAPVLIALHHHALPLGSRWLDELRLHDAQDLLGIVDEAPQVRAIVAGHVHQESDIARRGVRYLTTPSTCFQFLPHADEFAIDTRPPGFRWLDLHADGSFGTEVVWIDPPR